jgi:hypothetical protein
MKMNLILLASIVSISMVACKKDKVENPQEPQQTIVGFYAGKINNDPTSSEFPNNYSILFRQNGTARVFNMGASTDTASIHALNKIEGTWLQNGNSLQVAYKPIGSLITVSASVNKAASDVNGTWGFDGATKGKFFLNRK